MSYQDKERERLQRLRDRQLSARNPRKSDDRLMRQVARRGRRRQKKVTTFGEMLRDLPHKWRGLFIGIVAGMLLWIVLDFLAEGVWVDAAGVLAIVFLAFFGFVMGRAFDVRDELRRF